MRFALSEEQVAFGEALDRLLAGSEVSSTARAWATGDSAPGLALWGRLAELGVPALLVSSDHDGIGGSPLDLTVAFEALGRHGVPGPWIESVALTPALLAETSVAGEVLPGLAAGETRVSVAAPPIAPYAVDADLADMVLLLDGDTVSRGVVGEALTSVDATRRLRRVTSGEAIGTLAEGSATRALDLAALACAAQLLGTGERLLTDAVAYALQRKQFGRTIGEYQALKHALAQVRVGLDFARPLVHGAALALDGGTEPQRAVSAAKVAAADAAYAASRTALQVHGAIGYTAEFDLSLAITRVRALVGAWGTSDFHRGRVLDSLTAARS